MPSNDEFVHVRYLVDDVDASVAFYTSHFGFSVRSNRAPAFADVVRGHLRQFVRRKLRVHVQAWGFLPHVSTRGTRRKPCPHRDHPGAGTLRRSQRSQRKTFSADSVDSV